jgi:hypothetical protein
MATQAEVKKYIEDNYQCEVFDDGSYKLIFTGDDGRSQLLFVLLNEGNIQMSSPFASAEDVTPKQALVANAKYSMGMQLIGDHYVIKHFVPIEDVDASEIKEGFSLVCAIADQLEESLVGTDKL